MSEQDLRNAGYFFTPTLHNDTYDFISPKHQDLTGKRIFISGASRGIGRETALSYAKAGCSYIAFGARSPLHALENDIVAAAKEAKHPVPQTLCVELDVTDVKSVAAAAKSVQDAFGGLDILINNAGYLEPFVNVADADPEVWCRTQDVNVKGPFLVTRAVLPLLLGTKDGLKTILNVSSIGAWVIMPGASSYQMSKLSLLRLGEFLQTEYGDQGILVYGIHPGGVKTELASNMPEDLKYFLSDEPGLSADTTVWLTAVRREWLAGRYVSVNWDMEEFLQKKEEIVERDLLKVRMSI